MITILDINLYYRRCPPHSIIKKYTQLNLTINEHTQIKLNLTWFQLYKLHKEKYL